MPRIIVVVGYMGLVAVACGCAVSQAMGEDAARRTPILVELFTSEGCSDCPPADNLLKVLDEQQPIPGAQLIVLSEHVTYWNHDGWEDPFSLEELTDRQKTYVYRFGLKDSFTPQMVVDGAAQCVGNDVHALEGALEKAATQPKADVTIAAAQWGDGGAQFSVHATADKNARLVAVLAANTTHERVSAGENKGRMLEHVAVVRVMKEFENKSADGRILRLEGGPLTHKDEANGPVRLVVFLVDRKTGHVLGSAEQTLTR